MDEEVDQEQEEAAEKELAEFHITLPSKKGIKKHQTRDLLLMFSERLRVKFVVKSADGSDTAEELTGRWCFTCR